MLFNRSGRQHPATILFTHYGDEWIRGSERTLLDLLAHLDRARFTPIIWCNSHTMANEARRLGVPVYRTDFSVLLGWHRPRFNIRGFVALVRQGIELIDKHGVELIHANSGAPNQWLNLVARIRRIPLLTHLHARYPLRDRLTLGLHQVPMVVGVSQPVIEQLQQDGMSPERIGVIPNGVDRDRLERQQRVDLRSLLKLQKNDFVMVTAGSLIHRKGVDLIIDAVSRLIEQGIPAQLVIIGEGPERANLQHQIKRLGIEQNVHLLGERADVAGILRGGADLYVSAAREEVFGLVLAEAALAGLAVVAPKVGGIPGVVVDGKSGVLVPAEDVDALTQAILQISLVPQLRTEMGRAGRRHVLEHFTIQRNAGRFEQLYNRMLNEPAMQMGWYSHWQLRYPLINAIRRLWGLTLGRFFGAVTS